MYFMKKKYMILIGILAIGICLYIVYNDYMPPRKPIKVARIISGLPLSSDLQINVFDEKTSITGDYQINIRISLNDGQITELSSLVQSKGFMSLPIIGNNCLPLDGFWSRYRSALECKGYYSLKNNDSKCNITILDLEKKKLCIYEIYPVITP